ncbi:MAG: glutamate racemase [Lachnospiraceae bacterium]|nr:glutamate racemase [Lachnospiraceae bacterium]
MKELKKAPIGVFDSGVGGLTVAREIMRQMPNESIVYFGDTARVPYGSKSGDTILRYSRQITKFLLTHDVKAIVIACNTASAYAADVLRAECDIPVIDVIEPGAVTAVGTTKNNKVGVIATRATISSKMYTNYLHSLRPQIKVYDKACPLLVPLVEEGWLYDGVTVEVIDRYTSELVRSGIDTLVLGCTHYPLLAHTIQKVVGEKVTLVNPAYETAKELARVLAEQNLLCENGAAVHKFYVSDGAEQFRTFANTILPCEVQQTKDVNIEAYE